MISVHPLNSRIRALILDLVAEYHVVSVGYNRTFIGFASGFKTRPDKAAGRGGKTTTGKGPKRHQRDRRQGGALC